MQNNIEKSCVAVSPTQPTSNESVWIKKGKNIYDETTMLELTGQYRAGDNGSIITSATNKGLKVPVEPNKTYTITQTGTSSNYHEICFWDKNFNFLNGTMQNSTKINTPNNCYIITIQCNINATNIMINAGETALSYEPYIEKEIYVKNDNGVFERFYKEEENTAWEDLTLADGISAVTADGITFTPKIRKIGNVVEIRGIVSGISASYTKIATIPEKFRTASTIPHLYTTTNYNNGTYINTMYCKGTNLTYQRGGQTGLSGVRIPSADEKIILNTMYFIN